MVEIIQHIFLIIFFQLMATSKGIVPFLLIKLILKKVEIISNTEIYCKYFWLLNVKKRISQKILWKF